MTRFKVGDRVCKTMTRVVGIIDEVNPRPDCITPQTYWIQPDKGYRDIVLERYLEPYCDECENTGYIEAYDDHMTCPNGCPQP